MRIPGLIATMILVLTAGVTAGGLERIDIAPSALVNIGNGHGGRFMGAGLTTDLFFNRAFALRTTIGFSKNRYYPRELDYADADYGFWLTLAPYGEISLAGTVRPYLAVVGSFAGGSGSEVARPVGNNLAPVNRIQPAQERGGTYSLGGTLGTKVRLAGRVGLFAEITHYFYSSVSRNVTTLDSGLPDVTFNYDWDRSPTYVSLGLTYSIPLKK